MQKQVTTSSDTAVTIDQTKDKVLRDLASAAKQNPTQPPSVVGTDSLPPDNLTDAPELTYLLADAAGELWRTLDNESRKELQDSCRRCRLADWETQWATLSGLSIYNPEFWREMDHGGGVREELRWVLGEADRAILPQVSHDPNANINADRFPLPLHLAKGQWPCAPLLPDKRLYVHTWYCDRKSHMATREELERFARLFLDVWRKMPISFRVDILRQWGDDDVCVELIPAWSGRKGHVYGSCGLAGQELRFWLPLFRIAPDDVVKYIVAHELTHVAAHGWDLHPRNRPPTKEEIEDEESAVDGAVYSWLDFGCCEAVEWYAEHDAELEELEADWNRKFEEVQS